MRAARYFVVAGGIVAVLAVALFAYVRVGASVNSIQLLSLGYQYEEAVLREWGEPSNASRSKPFCGDHLLDGDVADASAAPTCGAPLTAKKGDCSPITSALRIAPELLPHDDEYFIDLAATDHSAEELAATVNSLTRESMLADGISRESQFFNLIGGTKTVTVAQCEGYALATIAQHYYRQSYPWSLFYEDKP
jgi:hypothetical protein